MAIVDWTSASWGPPAVDVAHMRANLAMSFGIEAADRFLEAYRAVAAPYAHDPCWDLRVAVDFLPDLSPEARPEFDRLDDFVARALAAL
jgi:aminoglycoside phosphotransferase (APT) family kinase protein